MRCTDSGISVGPRSGLLTAMGMMALLLGGGCYPPPEAKCVWSPDSRYVAWLKGVSRADPKDVDIVLNWMAVGVGQQEQRSVVVDTGETPKYRLWRGGRWAFSPDSQQVAITTSVGIAVVHLPSGRYRLVDQPPGCAFGDVVWFDSRQVVYVTYGQTREFGDVVGGRMIWCKRIDRPDSRRVEVYKDAGYTGFADALTESFSPNGRYAIFTTEGLEGRLRLLDLGSGQVRTFGKASGSDPIASSDVKVSWKPDASAAFCILGRNPDSDASGAVGSLIRTETGQCVDLTRELAAMGKTYEAEIVGNSGVHLLPRWTPDGRYVLLGAGAYSWLIRPEPWHVVPVGMRFARKVSPDVRLEVGLGMLPVPGWLWSVGPDLTLYAVDYSGKTLVPLERKGRSRRVSYSVGRDRHGVAWKSVNLNVRRGLGVSPDGKWRADGRSGRVEVEPFAIPGRP